MTATEPTQKMLSPQELSDRWGKKISTKTLANWRCGEFPKGPLFRRFGNKILYPIWAVERWEEENQYGSTSDYGKRRAA